MKDVIEHLKQEEWGEALVRLWCMACDGAKLNEWEGARTAGGFDQRVQALICRLDLGEVPSLDECHADPLELIRAIDQILWDETAPLAFGGRPYQVAEAEYWLWRAGTPGRTLTPLFRQAGSRAHWFRYHVIAPTTAGGISVRVEMAKGALSARAFQLAHETSAQVRVWIGHFNDNCRVIWDASHSTAGRVRGVGIEDVEMRTASIHETLTQAFDAAAHVVVLPEMAVTPDMRPTITASLEKRAPMQTPLLVVPGSFHETTNARCFNTAPLIDGCTGDALFTHCKLRVYGNLGQDGAQDQAEDIVIGSHFHVLATDLGTFAVLICKDFLDLDMQVATLLQQVPVDWILVPSYGSEKTLQAHQARACEVARKTVGCHVVLANIRDVGLSQGVGLPGFVHVQGVQDHTPVGSSGGMVPIELGRPSPPSPDKEQGGGRPALRRVK